MPGPAREVKGEGTQMRAALAQGLDYISEASEYQFQVYTQTILPLDGYVFWTPKGAPIKVKGSLHYGLETVQEADELAGDGGIVFTSEARVMTFGQTRAPLLYVVTVGENETDDPLKNPVRFAFGSQGNFYPQAGLWHYQGRRVMPAMASQLLDPGVVVDASRAIVSDSLPIWLSLNSYESPVPIPELALTLYPAFLAAENAVPPYATVDVVDTQAIASAPLLGSQFGSHTQLCRDVVDITFYGLQNNEALAFQDLVNQFSLDTDRLGIMNVPVVSDYKKRPQAELKAIAMKKCMRYEVSYYQNISAAVAHQLIVSAPIPAAQFHINPDPIS